ncbi:MAG: AAA family ATPase, partial [Muribaculaceae bacterium]|nr:AAA family ATPase [Muribaculaceae bacterium]
MVKENIQIKYPVGVQSFPEIREGGYLYVDKTAYIKMLSNGKYYFLSRPRRFGKSLLLSTLEAYFQGRRDLFEGLAIDSLTDDWDPHPVLHLDLNNRQYKDEGSLEAELNAHLEV